VVLMLLRTNEVGLYSFNLNLLTKESQRCRDNGLKPFERPLIVEASGRSYGIDWRLVS
jgi:hypothetical protein